MKRITLSTKQASAVKKFVEVPSVSMNRSSFLTPFNLKTTFNAGDLIPFHCEEVLPGDTWRVNLSAVVRSSTPITPVMDSAYLDVYSFFVPSRLLWDDWKAFMGENTKTKWFDQNAPKALPVTTAPTGGWDKGSVADYLGIPIDVDNLSVQSLPFRAYSLIWNEWFRDQNNQDPCLTLSDSNNQIGQKATDGNSLANAVKGGALLKLNKYHDYFTSALPSPQKGEDVLLPFADSLAPVVVDSAGGAINSVDVGNIPFSTLTPRNGDLFVDRSGIFIKNQTGNVPFSVLSNIGGFENIGADLSGVSSVSINDLRKAFQTQRFLERDARGGTRYIELLKSHFGVVSDDARQQRPELLGSTHQMLQVQQVLQTSGSNIQGQSTPQGTTGAFSLTGFMKNSLANKSFTEHGYILYVGGVRTKQTYSQGIHPMWSRSGRLDFYDPAFANIGEQPIFNKELYAQGNSVDDDIFGYKEPWAEYRFNLDRLSSSFRPSASENLSIWHYGIKFDNLPVLQSGFVEEVKDNIDRTLAINSSVADQFIADFEFNEEKSRVMPVISVPGKVDLN